MILWIFCGEHGNKERYPENNFSSNISVFRLKYVTCILLYVLHTASKALNVGSEKAEEKLGKTSVFEIYEFYTVLAV